MNTLQYTNASIFLDTIWYICRYDSMIEDYYMWPVIR